MGKVISKLISGFKKIVISHHIGLGMLLAFVVVGIIENIDEQVGELKLIQRRTRIDSEFKLLDGSLGSLTLVVHLILFYTLI